MKRPIYVAPSSADVERRPCTCHPDDNPPVPCPRMYALQDCRRAAALAAEIESLRSRLAEAEAKARVRAAGDRSGSTEREGQMTVEYVIQDCDTRHVFDDPIECPFCEIHRLRFLLRQSHDALDYHYYPILRGLICKALGETPNEHGQLTTESVENEHE